MPKPITIKPEWLTVFIPNPAESPYIQSSNTQAIADANDAIESWLTQHIFDQRQPVTNPSAVPGCYYLQPDTATAALLLKELEHFGLDDVDVGGDRAGIPVTLPSTKLRIYIGIHVARMLAELKRKRIDYELMVSRNDAGDYVLT